MDYAFDLGLDLQNLVSQTLHEPRCKLLIESLFALVICCMIYLELNAQTIISAAFFMLIVSFMQVLNSAVLASSLMVIFFAGIDAN